MNEDLAAAVAKATTENRVRELIAGGALLREAWDRFKVV